MRAAASALPRAAERPDLAALDEAEFAHLTRRALSHFGDLPRLAASPLTGLPLIDERLAVRGAGDDALERAAELKGLLAESIARLKPRAGGDFGTSDEWRHYNALYFPYVAGLKPYAGAPPPPASTRRRGRRSAGSAPTCPSAPSTTGRPPRPSSSRATCGRGLGLEGQGSKGMRRQAPPSSVKNDHFARSPAVPAPHCRG